MWDSLQKRKKNYVYIYNCLAYSSLHLVISCSSGGINRNTATACLSLLLFSCHPIETLNPWWSSSRYCWHKAHHPQNALIVQSSSRLPFNLYFRLILRRYRQVYGKVNHNKKIKTKLVAPKQAHNVAGSYQGVCPSVNISAISPNVMHGHSIVVKQFLMSEVHWKRPVDQCRSWSGYKWLGIEFLGLKAKG